MKGYRTWLQIGLFTAASMTVFGCATPGSRQADPVTTPVLASPQSSVAPPSETPAQPIVSPLPSELAADPTALPSDAAATPYGVRYVDLKVGTGVSPEPGQTCVVHYTGWLKETGKQFDSSLDRGKPYEFPHQRGRVILGWDEGVATMKVGGKRKLEIPPKLAYGEQGNYGIPANATLIFDIELLEVK